MADVKREIKLPHNLILEDRSNLSVSGVLDVDSFDEETVIIYTDMGELTVRGTGLHISKLNVETGELSLTGQVRSLAYSEDAGKQGGFFGRLFR